jgi:hypothetical protein
LGDLLPEESGRSTAGGWLLCPANEVRKMRRGSYICVESHSERTPSWRTGVCICADG